MEEDKTIGKYEIDSIAFWEGKKIVKNNTKEKIYYDRFAFQCYTDQIAQISGLFSAKISLSKLNLNFHSYIFEKPKR